jgi:hypothetical protein
MPAEKKFQAPTSKHQRIFKHQAPILFPPVRFEFGAWSFSGCWSLEFGIFFRVFRVFRG